MVAAVLLGLLIGLALGALGGGGSILAVPVLVYVAGQDPVAATATSLVAVSASAAVGATNHARAGKVRWGPAAAFIATAVPGSWLGSKVNGQIDGDVLLLGFSVLILVAAHRMLTACPSCTRSGEEEALAAEVPVVAGAMAEAGADVAGVGPLDVGAVGSPADQPAGDATASSALSASASSGSSASARSSVGGLHLSASAVARVLAAGSVVGFLTGLFGVGGGFVIVPALTLALGLTMSEAIATSLVVIVGNGLIALAFRGVGSVDWHIALPFTATMLVGSFAGSMLAHRLPAQKALNGFAVLLVAVAVGNGIAAAAALWG